MGGPLFQRGGVGAVSLTQHGEVFANYARQLLSLHDQALQAFDANSQSGVVAIGVPEDYAPQLPSSVLRAFQEVLPSATANIVFHQSSLLQRSLGDGAIDLAFLTDGECPDQGGPVVYRDRFVWAAPESVDVTKLDPLPIAVWDEGDGYGRTMMEALSKIDRAYRVSIVCQSMTGLLTAIRSGFAAGAVVSSSLGCGMRVLGAESGLPDLPDLQVRLERRKASKSKILDRLADRIQTLLADAAERLVHGPSAPILRIASRR